uniref:Uncharacterized protein n=1 Tax=Romanomermis culicivorax TaxID=13658 RepID=A0A915JSK0_ROMCU
ITDSTIDVNRICQHLDRVIESSNLESTVNDQDLRIIPTFYGERHYKIGRMSIENIGPKMCNLNRMMPEKYLIENGVENFKLTGRKSFLPILRQFAAKNYPNLNVTAGNKEDFGGFDAAYGCALYLISQKDDAVCSSSIDRE